MSDAATMENPVFDFTFHSSASPFAIPKQAYSSIHSHAGYGLIATGALVFDTADTSTPRVLLVQRSACDTMPLKWEVPGGACDDEDPTILHGAARELCEETGLKAKHMCEAVGNPHVFFSRTGKPICKLNFVVEVDRNVEGRLQPTLDPKEHEQFVWASEAEVKSERVGNIELDFTSEQLKDTVLRTFDALDRQWNDRH